MVRAKLLILLVLFSVFFVHSNAGEEEEDAFDVRQHVSSVSRFLSFTESKSALI